MMLQRFWQDDGGGVISPELALVAAILVVGLIVGLVALRTGVDGEIRDIGAAVETIDFTPELMPVDHFSTLSAEPDNGQSSFPQTVADLDLE